MLPPHWFAPSVHPGLPSSIPLTFPRNVPLLRCEVSIVLVLALIAHITDVAETDLETVCPTIAYGVPGCACGFTVVDSTTALTTAASPCGEFGDDSKKTGDLCVVRREGGRKGRIGDVKTLNGVVLLDGSVF